MVKAKIIVLLAILVSVSFSGCIEQIGGSTTEDSYLYHDPITIIFDNGFTVENGVTGGSGTVHDPYIISGWRTTSIIVRYTQKYFKIQDCKIFEPYKYSGSERWRGSIDIHRVDDGTCTIDNVISTDTSRPTISIYESNYNLIVNCIFTNHSVIYYTGAIYLNEASHTHIVNCVFNGNAIQFEWGDFYNNGIYFDSQTGYSSVNFCQFKDGFVGIVGGGHNLIKNCSFTNFADEGIFLGSYVTVDNCTFSNDVGGIEIGYATHDSIIKNCYFESEHECIHFMVQGPGAVQDCIIENCTITNSFTGLDIYESQRIIIRNNHISNCSTALVFRDDDVEHVSGCIVHSNFFIDNERGVAIAPIDPLKVENNIFYDNYFMDNSKDLSTEWSGDENGDLSKQIWNISKTPGINIIGGPYLGGNYWSDYDGIDNDWDGLGDTQLPYDCSGKIQYGGDWLPLLPINIDYPIADINGPYYGGTGSLIEFNACNSNDPDGAIAGYRWDWTNDGTWDTEWLGSCIKLHSYSNLGIYTVKLQVKDNHDLKDSDMTTVVIVSKQYALTVNIDGDGTVTSSPPGGIYDAGTEVILTAVPNSGYTFNHWSGDITGSQNPTIIAMDSDKTVTAHFEEIQLDEYTLTINVNPTDGGTVIAIPSGGTYEAGTRITLIAIPNNGYEFDHWSGDASDSDPTTTITMNSDKVVTAHFEKRGVPGFGALGAMLAIGLIYMYYYRKKK